MHLEVMRKSRMNELRSSCRKTGPLVWCVLILLIAAEGIAQRLDPLVSASISNIRSGSSLSGNHVLILLEGGQKVPSIGLPQGIVGIRDGSILTPNGLTIE